MNSEQDASLPAGTVLTRWSSIALLRCGGYGLLALAGLDLVETLVPLHFLNPSWEMQAMGTLIERAPVPFLALILLFCGEPQLRRQWEKILFQFLRFTSLVSGIAFFLMIPLLVNDTFRIENQTVARIGDQLKQQIGQAEKLDGMLAQAGPQELETLLKRLGRAPEGANLEELKQEVLEDIGKAKRSMRTQAEEARANQRLALHKKSVKWGLQAMVSGIAFICLWRLTNRPGRAKQPVT